MSKRRAELEPDDEGPRKALRIMSHEQLAQLIGDLHAQNLQRATCTMQRELAAREQDSHASSRTCADDGNDGDRPSASAEEPSLGSDTDNSGDALRLARRQACASAAVARVVPLGMDRGLLRHRDSCRVRRSHSAWVCVCMCVCMCVCACAGAEGRAC